MEQKKKTKKKLQGLVVKLSGLKTVKVETQKDYIHPLYRKQLKKKSSFLVHNERIDLKVGDKVFIESCRPISKRKRFRVVDDSKSLLNK
jgi:small subunit ribosomal protein S17